MKKTIIILAVASCYFPVGCERIGQPTQTSAESQTIQFEPLQTEPSLSTLDFQDGSGSILKNGVEIIHSSVFKPYFDAIHRNIELNFGIINGNTAHKLITLELPRVEFRKPLPPNITTLSITEQSEIKRKFAEAVLKYQEDSIAFFSDRTKRVNQFCARVDSSLEPYRSKLSDTTDLIPVFKIADKVFNYSFVRYTQNYLLLNSDGLDSYNRIPAQMKNKAVVILIGANGIDKTTIDTMVTKALQSTEQAIEFTLSNHK